MDERAEKYRSREKRKGKEISYFTGFGYCPYCRKPYHRKMNKGVEMLYCASNREKSLCKESESVFVEHLRRIIPLLVKKLKANEKELRAELENTFQDENSESNKRRISEIKGELEKARANYLAYEGLKSIDPKARASEVMKALRDFPDDVRIGDYDFRKLFKRLIVVSRDRLIFVLGSEDLSSLPYNPQTIPMRFIESYRYKVRATWSICHFGIYINR